MDIPEQVAHSVPPQRCAAVMSAVTSDQVVAAAAKRQPAGSAALTSAKAISVAAGSRFPIHRLRKPSPIAWSDQSIRTP